MIRSSIKLLFVGWQVDWMIKHSVPRTCSRISTLISPSLNVETFMLPNEVLNGCRFAMRLARVGLELPVNIL